MTREFKMVQGKKNLKNSRVPAIAKKTNNNNPP